MQRHSCNSTSSSAYCYPPESNRAFPFDDLTPPSSYSSSSVPLGHNCSCSNDGGLDSSHYYEKPPQASSTMNSSRSPPLDEVKRNVIMDYSLLEINKSFKLSDKEFLTKLSIVDGLCAATTLNQPYNEQQGLFIIGSTINGFGTEKGDLDVCLMMSTAPVPRSFAVTALMNLEKILKHTSRWHKCEVIRAIVPILSIFDETTNLTINLNINNIVGIRNSHLMRCYSNFDWRVQPLVIFVKKWAKFQQVNSAKNRTICSYALTLMVINYLQCGLGNRPVLPSIQQEYSKYFTEDIQSLSSHVLLPPYLPQSRNTMTLGELLLGFFELYGGHFIFDRMVISVRLGKLLSIDEVRHSPMSSESDWGDNQVPKNSYRNAQLYVEEPFNGTNVARSTYDPGVFHGVKEVFRNSYKLLKQTKDPYTLLSTKFPLNVNNA